MTWYAPPWSRPAAWSKAWHAHDGTDNGHLATLCCIADSCCAGGCRLRIDRSGRKTHRLQIDIGGTAARAASRVVAATLRRSLRGVDRLRACRGECRPPEPDRK